MKKKLIISLVTISVVILMLFAGDPNIHFESKSETARGCLTDDETDTAVVCEQITPLEELGHQIEQMCREGKRAEIDNYVVSKTISIEEAAVLAEKTPIMSYMKSYAENSFTIPTDGICMIAADVNNDGLEDLIEYGSADSNAMWNWRIANRLVIYLGKSDGSYELAYFQPVFDTEVYWEDLIEVLQYKDENYLLFSHQGEQYMMTIYWLSGGIPCGKLDFSYQCTGMNVELKEYDENFACDWLLDNSLEMYHTINYQHCNCKAYNWLYNFGSAEIEVTDENRIEDLHSRYGKRETVELNELLNEYSNVNMWGAVPNDGAAKPMMSDIDNDGIWEEYIKLTGEASAVVDGLPERGIYRHYDVLLSGKEWKYNGRHGGKRRLFYYMEKSDEETDFMKLCGLNIWAEELVPQSFFVEETPRGNVTYIVYQDINEFAQQIEGCLIKDGTFEKVVSLRYTPIMEFSLQYEFREKGVENRITYVICHAEDNKSVSLKWKENNGSEDKINQNIQSIIEKKLADIDWEENRFHSLGYYPIKATDEIFIFDYVIYYEVPWETVWDEKHTEIFSMEVNLVTGECREIGSEERETMSKEGCQQW